MQSRSLAVRALLPLLLVGGLAHAQLTVDQLRNQVSPGSTTPRIVNPPAVVPGVVVPGTQSPDLAAPSADSDLGARTSALASSPGDRTEFQLLVEQSVGRELPLFGHRLFAEAPSTFAPLEQVPVPADYVIGPGDEIHIRAWGQIDIDYKAMVNRDGTLFVPRVGTLNVAGLQYQNLDKFIRNAVARLFKNFELNVSLGQLRSIQIFVVGQARKPGSYVIGSLSTLVNALFASGGPTYKGSMRRIQLKRNNKTISEFDFYDLLLRGDLSKDAKLLPGDVIFIPPVGPLAAVSGSVNVPAIYELKPGTSLNDLVEMAGGLATTAAGQKVTVERVLNRETRMVEEFTLDTAGLRRELRDGDVVNVHTVSPRIANAVTLRGNVAETMRFAWKEGLKVSDVIPEKDALIVPGYWIRKNLAGRPENWLRGKSGAPDSTQAPGRAPAPAGIQTDLVRARVEVNWEYAVVERLDMRALAPILIPFNLGKAVLAKDPQHDLPLLPGDVITVFSVDDIRVPKGRKVQLVRLEGEFAAPGVYQISDGETLRDLVQRVGGLTANAYLYGAEFTRESARVDQQERLDAALARLEAEAERAALARAQAVVSAEQAESLEQQSVAQKALIARLKQIQATGRIVLGFKRNAVTMRDIPAIPLEDGDVLMVPPVPGTVNVFGAVYNQNAYIYSGRARAGDYLERAGGPTKDADKGSIYLVRADGTVISQQQKGWFGSVKNERPMPGDTIFVPESFTKFNLTKELKDWSQIFYQFALGVAAIKVLRDL
jgi:protein involved in polysaccharide export with SLBB domain